MVRRAHSVAADVQIEAGKNGICVLPLVQSDAPVLPVVQAAIGGLLRRHKRLLQLDAQSWHGASVDRWQLAATSNAAALWVRASSRV